MNDTLRSYVAERLNVLGTNPFEAARKGGLERSYLNDILIGKKNSIRDDKKEQVARALEVNASDLHLYNGGKRKITQVRVAGFANAGSDEIAFAEGQGPFGYVNAPAGANEHTVAVEIRGTSLGKLFDRWLAFYDDRRDPPDDSLVGRVCICGLAGGQVVIKRMMRGSRKGLWHLESASETAIFDANVEWAAPVTEMRPKK